TPPGFDRTRNAEIGNKDIKFKHLEEAFTSEHWLVRIYKVKELDNRETLDHKLRSVVTKQKYTSKKVTTHQEQAGPEEGQKTPQEIKMALNSHERKETSNEQ
ncbi:Dolichyl-diphosphooligosaccharide--protein glycosyltransferase subunit stt3b, partial [Goodea atripinnis]